MSEPRTKRPELVRADGAMEPVNRLWGDLVMSALTHQDEMGQHLLIGESLLRLSSVFDTMAELSENEILVEGFRAGMAAILSLLAEDDTGKRLTVSVLQRFTNACALEAAKFLRGLTDEELDQAIQAQ